MSKAFPLRARAARWLLNLLRPRRVNGCWNCGRWYGWNRHTAIGCRYSYTSSKCWCGKWTARQGKEVGD